MARKKQPINFGNDIDDQQIALSKVTVEYIQAADSDAPRADLQTLKIETADAGEGIYLVLSSERWAIDSLEELTTVINDFQRWIQAVETEE